MEYRGPGRRPLSVVLALIVVLGLFGIGTSEAYSHTSAVHVESGSMVAVTASSPYKFTPALISNVATSTAASNTSINVTFTNGDTISHTLTISSRQGWVIPSTYTPDQLTSFFDTYKPMINLQATNPGTYTGNFTAPVTPGWYEFVCNESGHFQEGMYGFIAFGEPLPSNLSVGVASVGPGAAVFIIVGTIVALTVIAIVLGFVVGRRRGATDEMPPERLGYPEPKSPAEPAPPPGAPPKGR
jgi:plastocyanin